MWSHLSFFSRVPSQRAQPLPVCTRIRREQRFSSPDTNWIKISPEHSPWCLWKNKQYCGTMQLIYMPVTLWLLPWCKINWMKEIFEGGAAQGFLLFKGTSPWPLLLAGCGRSLKFLEKIWIVWDAAQIKLSSTELHGWYCRNDLKEFVDGSIVLAVAVKGRTRWWETPPSHREKVRAGYHADD